MELYVKHKDLNLWEITKNGPVVIEKLKDQFTNDDQMMTKNYEAINLLYCGISIDICDYVFHCKSAKEIWNYLYC